MSAFSIMKGKLMEKHSCLYAVNCSVSCSEWVHHRSRKQNSSKKLLHEAVNRSSQLECAPSHEELKHMFKQEENFTQTLLNLLKRNIFLYLWKEVPTPHWLFLLSLLCYTAAMYLTLHLLLPVLRSLGEPAVLFTYGPGALWTSN